MTKAKEYYKGYVADGQISPIGEEMIQLIRKDRCVHAFEFGAGNGKHIRRLNYFGIDGFGMDVSLINCVRAAAKDTPMFFGDENYLRHMVNCDAVFTVSVLDHIEEIDGIIGELKRIANKVVYLLETNDVPGEFYYPHNYENYGFKLLSNDWTSDGDGARYQLWRWYKGQTENMNINDDLA